MPDDDPDRRAVAWDDRIVELLRGGGLPAGEVEAILAAYRHQVHAAPVGSSALAAVDRPSRFDDPRANPIAFLSVRGPGDGGYADYIRPEDDPYVYTDPVDDDRWPHITEAFDDDVPDCFPPGWGDAPTERDQAAIDAGNA